MAKLSKKRQQALAADADAVRKCYAAACERFGTEALAKSPTLLWTMRCMQGVQGVLPFGATVSKNVSEWLYVAREVCGYVEAREPS